MFYITLYLGAAVLANLVIARFGSIAAIPTAFFLVGLDLTSRDHLHEAWRGKGLVWKMGLLIAVGSILSWFLNRDAGQIALASFLAFACAATVDTITYHLLRDKVKFIKVNGSNILSGAVDSIVFPTIAFGVFLPAIILGQFVAKVAGGFVWFSVLQHLEKLSAERPLRCRVGLHPWEHVGSGLLGQSLYRCEGCGVGKMFHLFSQTEEFFTKDYMDEHFG